MWYTVHSASVTYMTSIVTYTNIAGRLTTDNQADMANMFGHFALREAVQCMLSSSLRCPTESMKKHECETCKDIKVVVAAVL